MTVTPKKTEISRAIHTAEGLLKGISSDSIISPEEIEYLETWLVQHKKFQDIIPFSEIYEYVSFISKNKDIDTGLTNEFIEFCNSFNSAEGEVDLYTKDMRTLHGILQGVIADKKINKAELEYITNWIKSNHFNKDKWPIKQLNSLIKKILKDGTISSSEENEFISFANDFSQSFTENYSHDDTILPDKEFLKNDAPVVESIFSITDNKHSITIKNKQFCFTGQMKAGKRKDIEIRLKDSGGIPRSSIIKELDYLVIGANSNPCWIYSTYGRKIEQVMKNNEDGSKTIILHEDRFIDAL